jgi:hypothetical protein
MVTLPYISKNGATSEVTLNVFFSSVSRVEHFSCEIDWILSSLEVTALQGTINVQSCFGVWFRL